MKSSTGNQIKRKIKKHWLDIVFVVPLIVFVFSFTVVPIIQTGIMSFQDQYSGVYSSSSYQYMAGRPQFGEAIRNTLVFTAIALFIQIIIGFFIAMLLKQSFVGKGLARAFVLLPMGVPTLVSGVAMSYIFSTSGYLNELVYRLGISKIPVNWTGDYLKGMIIVAIADSWKVMPMVVLLFLSGLESVPNELYEAGNIDGTNWLQRLWYITLPQVKAVATMTILMRVVDLLRAFEMPQVLLGARNPFMGTLAYQEYQYGNKNYSAVASTVLMVIIVVTVSAYMFLFERERKGKRYADDNQ